MGMFPTPNASSTIPRTPLPCKSPYANSGAHPGTMGTRSTFGFSFKRGVYSSALLVLPVLPVLPVLLVVLPVLPVFPKPP